MSIASVVTRGYSNGTFVGSIPFVVTRGYGTEAEPEPEPPAPPESGAGTPWGPGYRERRYPTRELDDLADKYVRKIEDEARESTRKKALTEREKERRREAVAKAKAAEPKVEIEPIAMFAPGVLPVPEMLGEALLIGQEAMTEEEFIVLMMLSA